MRAKLTSFALTIAVVVSLFSMTTFAAQEKKGEKKGAAEKANVQGTVQNIGKDTSTITVRVGTSAGATRQVVYDAKTKFMYGHSDNNKPGNVAQLKESNFVSCVGTFNAKSQLMATECVYRESK